MDPDSQKYNENDDRFVNFSHNGHKNGGKFVNLDSYKYRGTGRGMQYGTGLIEQLFGTGRFGLPHLILRLTNESLIVRARAVQYDGHLPSYTRKQDSI